MKFKFARSADTAVSLLNRAILALFAVAWLSACSNQNPSEIDPVLQTDEPGRELDDGAAALADDLGLPSVQKPGSGNPVRVSVSAREWSDANILMRLTGEATSLGQDPIVRTQWHQVAGPQATILSPDEQTSFVLLPDLAVSADVEFRFAAVDEAGFANSAYTSIHVLPVTTPFKLTSVAGAEDIGELKFVFRLALPASAELELNYVTADSGARAGQDYESISGSVVIPQGKSSATIAVPIINDSFREQTDSFTLSVTGEYAGGSIAVNATGFIIDDEAGPIATYGAPVEEGPSNQSQVQLGGQSGVVRFVLEWAGNDTDMNLRVSDPCGNILSASSPSAACQQTDGIFSQSADTGELSSEDAGWAGSAPIGSFAVELEHIAGVPTDYVLRVFLGNESKMFKGTLGDGEVAGPLHFEFEGGSGPVEVQAVGAVVSATSAQPLQARVIVRRSEADPVLLDMSTDEQGQFEFIIEAGTYYVEIQSEGYIDWHETISFAPDKTNRIGPALSPEFIGQAGRIVLQWGEAPSDLDAHLEGPLPAGDRFHISYNNRTVQDIAELDVDDTSAFGPETITIHSLSNGTYEYRVHDFTNARASESYALAESGAVVKVFTSDGQELTFLVPNEPGTVWTVFVMDGSTGVITPVNSVGNGD